MPEDRFSATPNARPTAASVVRGYFQWHVASQRTRLTSEGLLKFCIDGLDGRVYDAFVEFLENVRQPIALFDGLHKFWVVVEKYGRDRYGIKPTDNPRERTTDEFVSPTKLAEAQRAAAAAR